MRIAATEDVVQKGDATDVHLPSPSYWPLVLAVGLPFIGYGLIFNLWLCRRRRRICVVAGIYGWVLEPSVDDEAGHDDHHEPDDGPRPATPTRRRAPPSADEEAALVD